MMQAFLEDPLDPFNLFVMAFLLVALAAQIAVLIKPEIAWRRMGRNRLEAMPPRLAAVMVWMTRAGAALAIVVVAAFPFV